MDIGTIMSKNVWNDVKTILRPRLAFQAKILILATFESNEDKVHENAIWISHIRSKHVESVLYPNKEKLVMLNAALDKKKTQQKE